MASEDIIKHIIRDIVAKSTVILKTTAPQSELPTIEDSLLSTPLIDMFVGGVPSFVKAPVVSDTLTAFVIRSVVLDPANEFGTDRELSPEQVDRLVSV